MSEKDTAARKIDEQVVGDKSSISCHRNSLLLDQMLLAWADTSGMAKSLDARAAGSYKVEYLNFGSISRSSHLQQNTATTAVTTSLTNAGFADGYDCVRERRVA